MHRSLKASSPFRSLFPYTPSFAVLPNLPFPAGLGSHALPCCRPSLGCSALLVCCLVLWGGCLISHRGAWLSQQGALHCLVHPQRKL